MGSHSAYGQVEVRPGVRGGVALMTIADLPGESERRTGLSAGGFVTVDLPGPFALQPELLYVQKGATAEQTRRTADGQFIVIDQAVETGYLELVALGEIQVPGVPLVTPTIGVGPTVGTNLSSNLDLTARVFDQFGEEQQIDLEQPPKLDARSLETGLLASAGVNVDVAFGTVSVSGRYRTGLTDASDGGGSSDQLDLGTNRGFSITAGILF